MRACRRDATPLVWTFEQPGAEWHCLKCGGWFSIFDCVSIDQDAEMVRRYQYIEDLFRSGVRGPFVESLDAPSTAGEPIENEIHCDGCGAASGRSTTQGKPSAWYSRVDADGEQFACTRGCIDIIAESTGKTKVVLPW